MPGTTTSWGRRVPAAASLFTFAWFLIQGLALDMKIAIAFSTVALFGCCMFCHGELVRLKPDPRHLTGFWTRFRTGWADQLRRATTVARGVPTPDGPPDGTR